MSDSFPGLFPKFALSDPVAEDPYPTYARLREAGRICRVGPGEFAISHYADVVTLLSDPRLDSEFPREYYRLSAGVGPAQEFLERIMLHRDGAKHKAFRQALLCHFNAPALPRLRNRVSVLVDQLVDVASDTGQIDAVRDLAWPLPAMVLFEIMGIPVFDVTEIRLKVMELGKAFATRISHEDRVAANEAVLWLRRYASQLLETRRRAPGADFLSHLLSAGERIGDWSEEDSVDNILFFLFAGFETTSSVLSTGCAALSVNPSQLDLLHTNPSLVPNAVEEFIRFDAPIQSRLRIVRVPVVIGDREVRPGRVLLLLIGSANRDERQFRNPDAIDVTRNPNAHLSFGGGGHVCLGMGLARLEGKIVFEKLARRFSTIEPAGAFIRNLAGPFRSFDQMPLAVRRK